MLSHLSKSLNLPVLFVEYSLSPEHPYPAANNEIFKIYQQLITSYPTYNISVIGDSAGGGLAISLVNDAQKAGLRDPASIALISPWIDLKTKNESYRTKQAVDPILNQKFLAEHAVWYANGKMKEADPSEIRFRRFPPVLILVGTDEVLNDDAKHFYTFIKPIQRKSELKEFDRQKHVWIFSHIGSKASVEALADIKNFINYASK